MLGVVNCLYRFHCSIVPRLTGVLLLQQVRSARQSAHLTPCLLTKTALVHLQRNMVLIWIFLLLFVAINVVNDHHQSCKISCFRSNVILLFLTHVSLFSFFLFWPIVKYFVSVSSSKFSSGIPPTFFFLFFFSPVGFKLIKL